MAEESTVAVNSTSRILSVTGLEPFWPPQNPSSENKVRSESELRDAIEHCKELVLQMTEHSSERRQLVRQLILLRKQLLDLKEGPEDALGPTATVNGHLFVDWSSSRNRQENDAETNRYCEQCYNLIWVLQSAYRCKACGYLCHVRCAPSVSRTCVAIKVAENPVFILDICPEKGLAEQKYRCAECRTRLAVDSNDDFPAGRLCDYSGLYYCQKCHWNDTAIIPARLLRNWDFQPRFVSRMALQFLRLMRRKPVFRLESLNPALFSYIQELREIKNLRSDLIIMKPFLMCCREAKTNQRLFSLLKPYTHFIDNVDVYSIQDLIDLQCGSLKQHLVGVADVFMKHIRECRTCRGNGFICELCNDNEVLFLFNDFVSSCRLCSAIFHRVCFEKNRRTCPRCERRRRRSEMLSIDEPGS